MEQGSITASGVIDTFLLLLIGVGPKIALVPFLEMTAALDEGTKARVRKRMLVTASTAAVILGAFGEFLRRLLHFSVGSLGVAGGVILLVQAVHMVMATAPAKHDTTGQEDPMELALVPLAVPYLLNPVGIVALITLSGETGSVSVLLVQVALLASVLLLDVVVFRWADSVSSKLDAGRMLVVEKVFAFLLAAIAVELVLQGLDDVGVLTVEHL